MEDPGTNMAKNPLVLIANPSWKFLNFDWKDWVSCVLNLFCYFNSIPPNQSISDKVKGELELPGLAKANLWDDIMENKKNVDVDCQPAFEIPQLDGLEDPGEFCSI